MSSSWPSKILPLYVVAVATGFAQVPDESEIRAVIKRMEQGWNTHDMNLYMSVFPADASFVNVNGWDGRQTPEATHGRPGFGSVSGTCRSREHRPVLSRKGDSRRPVWQHVESGHRQAQRHTSGGESCTSA